MISVLIFGQIDGQMQGILLGAVLIVVGLVTICIRMRKKQVKS